jgi:hypothetical protein
MAKNKGDEIVEGLRELLDVLRSGEPLASRFGVHSTRAERARAIGRTR